MNKARLEYEMSVRGVTRAKLCEVLGISPIRLLPKV